jgi:ABC-type sugar transport system ATPase subunit
MARVPKAEREQRVRRVAEMLELEEYLARKPSQLSAASASACAWAAPSCASRRRS